MMGVRHSLQPRAQRLDLSFPVVFSVHKREIRGNCLNLSESGLLAVFSVELDIWAQGELQLTAGLVRHVQRARVARVQEREAGFAFAFACEAEREVVRQLLTTASATPWLVGAPPF